MSKRKNLLAKVAQNLRPLEWRNKRLGSGESYNALAISPVTRYVIIDDGRGVKVIYHNFAENEPAKTKPGFKSVAEAKEWVHSEHYPSKMAPWITADQWISVKKKLPDEYVAVQVACQASLNGNPVAFMSFATYKNGKWYCIEDFFGSYILDVFYGTDEATDIIDFDVTHWKPLPEPPTEVPDDV